MRALVIVATGRLDINDHGLPLLATGSDEPFSVRSRQQRRGGGRGWWLQACPVLTGRNRPLSMALGGVGSVGSVGWVSNLSGPVSAEGRELIYLGLKPGK